MLWLFVIVVFLLLSLSALLLLLLLLLEENQISQNLTDNSPSISFSQPVTWQTSNMTSCHQGLKLLTYVANATFSSSSVASRAFSALCVYSMFRHHPHLLGYLCAKFCFFCGLHCWPSPWTKIAYLINQSLLSHSSSIFDAQGTKACASE